MIPLAIWCISLAKTEILTHKYHDDFEYAYTSNTMLGDMEYFKVLKCDGSTAEVYYVSEGRSGGDVLFFEKQNGEWIETGWECIWARSGSASGVVFSYWWHFIFGGL